MNILLEIAFLFQTEGQLKEIKPLGEGFINDTYLVFVEGKQKPAYILQRKNHLVFPDVPAMMDNINRVTHYIKTKVKDPLRETLTVIPAKDGQLYVKDTDGNFWAMCLYIPDTKSFFAANSPELAYKGGLGLGEFHRLVNGFSEPLAEVIKGFHNIRWRFTQWDASLASDKVGRKESVKEEIGWIESRREKMLSFWERYERGEFPMRTTHNDTKISNFLFEEKDDALLCAIDLDTLMSSTLLNDVGDALRSYTNTAAEDEPDKSKVSMSMAMFSAYVKGYLERMSKLLTESEIESLAFSGLYICYEQVLRFLMDYIDGDTYYKIAYPEHNLVRARSQYWLLSSMESQLQEMNDFVRSCIAQNK